MYVVEMVYKEGDGDGVGWRLCVVELFNLAIALANRTGGSRYGQLVSKDKEEKQRRHVTRLES